MHLYLWLIPYNKPEWKEYHCWKTYINERREWYVVTFNVRNEFTIYAV